MVIPKASDVVAVADGVVVGVVAVDVVSSTTSSKANECNSPWCGSRSLDDCCCCCDCREADAAALEFVVVFIFGSMVSVKNQKEEYRSGCSCVMCRRAWMMVDDCWWWFDGGMEWPFWFDVLFVLLVCSMLYLLPVVVCCLLFRDKTRKELRVNVAVAVDADSSCVSVSVSKSRRNSMSLVTCHYLSSMPWNTEWIQYETNRDKSVGMECRLTHPRQATSINRTTTRSTDSFNEQQANVDDSEGKDEDVVKGRKRTKSNPATQAPASLQQKTKEENSSKKW